jgi:hypothetical protein
MRDLRRHSSTIFVAFLGGACTTSSDATPDSDGIDEASAGADTSAGGTGTGTGGAPSTTATDDPSTPGSDGSEGGGSDDATSSPVVWDVGVLGDVPGFTCGAPSVFPCDDGDDDPWHAIGLNCPGGSQVEGEVNGAPEAFYVHEGNMGTFEPPPFPPREGDKFLVMSSGNAQDMTVANMFASTDVAGFVDGGVNPPAPIVVTSVSPTDTCATDPGLVGTGDCSNTIQEQWDQGSGAHDYAEMRFTAEVPFMTFGFSYDLAMFSTEYPNYYQTGFNDMYIGWLESELWTGNISFDEMGNPISLNAGFLDYKDAPNPFDCPGACAAPELAGTAMVGHAGTKWLTTTAGVTPGEDITMVFAVFDVSDGVLDTVVFLDNFQWGCEGGAPVTIPG